MPQPAPDSQKIICNDPRHQELAQQIYKRGLELVEEKKHTENLLYNISEAVVAVDREYKIRLVNKTAEELLSTASQEAEGKDLGELLKLTDDQEKEVTPENYCFKPTDVTLQNMVLESPKGRRYLKLQSTSIKNPQGEDECIITLTDITREKLLEKSKDDFISITSHELRTPMTIIKSYLWMLGNAKYGKLTDKQLDYLVKAQGGVERMLNMINDTLSASKIDQNALQLRIEELDIRSILESINQDFGVKAQEKGLVFTSKVGEDCRYVYTDRGKLQEMLINLLGNSIKFTSTGWIKLTVEKTADDFIKFTVNDSGKGIDPENIKRLFHKFGRIDNSYQTVAESGGTGLGLYIVKNLVESMGGAVGVESAGLNKGSTFWFILPGEYYKVPQHLRDDAVTSLAPVLETHISSICPV